MDCIAFPQIHVEALTLNGTVFRVGPLGRQRLSEVIKVRPYSSKTGVLVRRETRFLYLPPLCTPTSTAPQPPVWAEKKGHVKTVRK